VHYIADENNYILHVYFGCTADGSTEYTGAMPAGYSELTDWATNEDVNAWMLVDGDLVKDNVKANENAATYAGEQEQNRHVYFYELEPLRTAVQTIVEEQPYKTDTKTNRDIALAANAKALPPTIKITGIEPYKYSKIDLIVNGRNILPNTATSMELNGLTFTQNEDRSITINGTATADTEYNLAGTSSNTNPILLLKRLYNYYLGTSGFTLKMYYYNGTSRTQIYSGTDGTLNYNQDEPITQITIAIANGTTLNNQTIYPKLTFAANVDYEPYKVHRATIDFSEFLTNALFPAQTLYPDDNLYPAGSNVEYILADGSYVSGKIDGQTVYMDDISLPLFSGTNYIYAIQHVKLDVTYYINSLDDQGEFATKIELANETTKASIVAKINNNTSSVKIDADNVDIEATDVLNILAGNTINLTSKNIAISSTNFSVTKNGNLSCSNANVSGTITSNNVNITGGRLDFTKGTGTGDIILRSTSGDELTMYGGEIAGFANGGNYELRLRCASSDVGILVGDWYQNKYTQIDATGITTPTVVQTSRKEYKKNIKKLENSDALQIVLDTDIYKYNLKGDAAKTKKHIGFVIGDNYKYSNEITAEDKEGKEIGVDTYSMAAASFGAIQELYAMLLNQQKEIDALKEEIKKLKGGI
jgi:hypothetical protein